MDGDWKWVSGGVDAHKSPAAEQGIGSTSNTERKTERDRERDGSRKGKWLGGHGRGIGGY